MNTPTTHRDLLAWREAMTLVEVVYRDTASLPKEEMFGLTAQIRRAAVSVPSNIAEGYGRQATGEYRHHLSIARASLLELETQVLLCHRLSFLDESEVNSLIDEIEEISKMIASLISKIR